MVTRKKRRKAALPVIGWREWVSLPDLGVPFIKAKIDSGARSSSIHAFRIREQRIGGDPWVGFELHPLQDSSQQRQSCLVPILGRRKVRSSNGQEEERYVIRTTIALGGISWPLEITLANRDEMGFRLLLGRTAIRNRFLIHCGRSFLQSEKAAHHTKAKEQSR